MNNSRCNAPASAFWTEDFVQRINAMVPAEKKKLLLELETLTCSIRQSLGVQPPPAPNIPKGFVMVNLGESEKRELRDLARECGLPLRSALRYALFKIRFYLREKVKIQRQTGWKISEQSRFMDFMSESN